MSTASSVEVPDGASGASLRTPPCRVSACSNVAETTSWTPPLKSANVRVKALIEKMRKKVYKLSEHPD